MTPPLLDVSRLSKSFDAVRAVNDVSFSVERGAMVALIGPNGAGKTTCFNLLNGQLTPDAGTVHIAGTDVTRWPPRAIFRLGVGRTFQVADVFDSMTVRENVQAALISRHGNRRIFWRNARSMHLAEADALLDRVGLLDQESRPCGMLAYGDLKRLDLAMGLANDPQLLLMDEPAAGMAPADRHRLMTLTADIVRERNIGVLFTEHDMDIVFKHASSLIVFNKGEIIASGDPATVRADGRVQELYLGSKAR